MISIYNLSSLSGNINLYFLLFTMYKLVCFIICSFNKYHYTYRYEGHSVDLFLKYIFLKDFFLAGSKNRFQNRYLFWILHRKIFVLDLFWKLFLTVENRVWGQFILWNLPLMKVGGSQGVLEKQEIAFMWTYVTY